MAKAAKNLEFKIGALIIVALTIIIVFVLLLGDFTLEPQAYLYVDYPNTGQMQVGAPVRIAGVKVGKIKEIQLWAGRMDPKVHRRVMVRVKIRVMAKRLKDIHEDAKFYIATEGLLGQKYIEIDPGSQNLPHAKPNEVFLGVSPLKLEDFAASADSILKEISTALHDNKHRFEKLLDDSDALVNNTNELVTTAKDMLNENRDGIKRVIAAAVDTMETTRNTVKAYANIVDKKKLDEIVNNILVTTQKLKGLDRMISKAELALDDTSKVIEDVKPGILKGTKKAIKLMDTLSKIADNFHKSMNGNNSLSMLLKDKQLYWDLIEFIKDIKHHPWKLILKE